MCLKGFLWPPLPLPLPLPPLQGQWPLGLSSFISSLGCSSFACISFEAVEQARSKFPACWIKASLASWGSMPSWVSWSRTPWCSKTCSTRGLSPSSFFLQPFLSLLLQPSFSVLKAEWISIPWGTLTLRKVWCSWTPLFSQVEQRSKLGHSAHLYLMPTMGDVSQPSQVIFSWTLWSTGTFASSAFLFFLACSLAFFIAFLIALIGPQWPFLNFLNSFLKILHALVPWIDSQTASKTSLWQTSYFVLMTSSTL